MVLSVKTFIHVFSLSVVETLNLIIIIMLKLEPEGGGKGEVKLVGSG